MKKLKIVLAVILFLITVPVFIGYVFVSGMLGHVVDEGVGTSDLMANPNLEESGILNIALFGVDCRTTDFTGCRSDAMMILSLNEADNHLTVTSIPRDTFVMIPNRGLDKINHAYVFGGPELAIQTINHNFDLDIRNYITVDFWAVEKIIDAVGGVEVALTEAEFPEVNRYIKDLNRYSPTDEVAPDLLAAGRQIITGRQAVSYMRIRSVGDGDFERTNRQRNVLSTALSGIQDLNVAQRISLANNLLGDVRTNLTKGDMTHLLTRTAIGGIPDLSQQQIPSRKTGGDRLIDGVYYFVPLSLVDNVKLLHEQLYPKRTFEPSETVKQINQEINEKIE